MQSAPMVSTALKNEQGLHAYATASDIWPLLERSTGERTIDRRQREKKAV